ncbi:MFS general substrate transporter, partial [Caulochytrium protostelioides]
VLVLPHKHLGPTRANEKIDWLGAFFGVISLMLIIFAFNQGGVVGWKPPYIYVLLIVGVALFGVFLFIEFRCPYAIMPPSIFTRSRAVALVLICVGLGWGAFSVYWMYGVTWLISNGNSPLLSVAKISPVAVTGVLATIVVAVLIHRIRAHWIFMGAMLAFFASNLLLATMPENQSYWYNFFWAVVVAPFGMDMSFPASGIILSNIVSKHEQGIAQSLVNTVVNLSIALTLGVAGTSQVYLVQAGHSLNYSFKAQFWLGAAMGAVGLIISMFIRVPRGDGSKYLAKEAIDPDAKEDRDLTAELPAAGLPADSEAGTAHDLKGLSEKEAA